MNFRKGFFTGKGLVLTRIISRKGHFGHSNTGTKYCFNFAKALNMVTNGLLLTLHAGFLLFAVSVSPR